MTVAAPITSNVWQSRAAWVLPVLCGVLLVLVIAIRAHAARDAVLRADPELILRDPKLANAALSAGGTVFRDHCASCHGADGKGDQPTGVPNLTDHDHLYGEGRVSEIEDIVRYGIRAFDKRGWNLAAMPAYASAVPYKGEALPPQTPQEIEALTQYLLSFTGRSTDPAMARRGKQAYEAAGCWDCHAHDASGDAAIGAPTLTDTIWLYGGTHDAIARTLSYGRAGISPAFGHRLDAAQIRNVAVYVASLAPPPAPRDDK